MLRLIYNDFRLNSTWFVWAFFLLNLELGIHVGIGFYSTYTGLGVGLSWAMVPPLILFMREDFWRTQVVGRSLPISPEKFVIARYVAVCMLGLLPALYGMFFQRIFEILGPHLSHYETLIYRAQQMESGYGIEHSLIARAIGLSLALAIVMPLVIRFRSVWGVFFGFIGLRVVWSFCIDYLLDFSLHTTFFLGLSRWMFFATVFILAILLLSSRVSVWLFDKQDL